MRILADRVIAEASAAFAAYGEVTLFDGRELDPAQVKSADILLVRSVTAVNQALIESAPLKFVGTATAGTDHIDQVSLSNAGIEFSAAPGCNANAVAEFILTSVLLFCASERLETGNLTVGVIGHGAVGSLVAQKLAALGMRILLNDPPKALTDEGQSYTELEEALGAEIVTIHAPLVKSGAHSTYHLLDERSMQSMANCRLLINAARGGIIDETALMMALDRYPKMKVQIDCWEHEPEVNLALLARCFRASTHIAGHSVEARLNATRMLALALEQWSGITNPWLASPQPKILPSDKLPESNLDGANDQTASEILAQVLGGWCPINDFDAATKALAEQSATSLAARFDALRRRFAGRREFTHYQAPSGLSRLYSPQILHEIGITNY